MFRTSILRSGQTTNQQITMGIFGETNNSEIIGRLTTYVMPVEKSMSQDMQQFVARETNHRSMP